MQASPTRDEHPAAPFTFRWSLLGPHIDPTLTPHVTRQRQCLARERLQGRGNRVGWPCGSWIFRGSTIWSNNVIPAFQIQGIPRSNCSLPSSRESPIIFQHSEFKGSGANPGFQGELGGAIRRWGEAPGSTHLLLARIQELSFLALIAPPLLVHRTATATRPRSELAPNSSSRTRPRRSRAEISRVVDRSQESSMGIVRARRSSEQQPPQA